MNVNANAVLVGEDGRASQYFLALLKTLADLPTRLSGQVVWNPANVANGASTSTTVPVAGAQLGMDASASFSLDTQGMGLTATVTQSGIVTVVLINNTGGALNLASGTLQAFAWKP